MMSLGQWRLVRMKRASWSQLPPLTRCLRLTQLACLALVDATRELCHLDCQCQPFTQGSQLPKK